MIIDGCGCDYGKTESTACSSVPKFEVLIGNLNDVIDRIVETESVINSRLNKLSQQKEKEEVPNKPNAIPDRQDVLTDLNYMGEKLSKVLNRLDRDRSILVEIV